MKKQIDKIISGGQTGADRAALDFALEKDIETGGFVPKNRWAEDGRINGKYPNLRETATEQLAERTKLNVKNADATLILSHGELTGGSCLTKELAEKYQKPVLHLDFSIWGVDEAVEMTKKWLDSIECETLNIAGSRASEDADIYETTLDLLRNLFSERE
jgi:hypothetical protein